MAADAPERNEEVISPIVGIAVVSDGTNCLLGGNEGSTQLSPYAEIFASKTNVTRRVTIVLLIAVIIGCSRAATIDRVSVSSSAINSIGYSDATKVLQIEFSGGEVYEYVDVPADVHRAMMSASSKGKFFHAQIKPNYSGKRIE